MPSRYKNTRSDTKTKRVGFACLTCITKSNKMAVPAYRQKYSTAGSDVALPSMKAKKFVMEVSAQRAHEEEPPGVGTIVHIYFYIYKLFYRAVICTVGGAVICTVGGVPKRGLPRRASLGSMGCST